MESPQPTQGETDPRFPSGRWTGYFLQKLIPGKHQMELLLTFRRGEIKGEGRDWVGAFIVRGRYNLADGRCHWVKRYLGKHDVFYEGFNEGKGIWGTWELPENGLLAGQKGGFRIWPEGMADPDTNQLAESAQVPDEKTIQTEEPVLEPVGS